MKLDTFISHLRSILLTEGNLEVTQYPDYYRDIKEEETLEDEDIQYSKRTDNTVDIYIGNLHLTK